MRISKSHQEPGLLIKLAKQLKMKEKNKNVDFLGCF